MCARGLRASCSARVLRRDRHENEGFRLGCPERGVGRGWVQRATTILAPTWSSPRARAARRDRVLRAWPVWRCVCRRPLPNRAQRRAHARLTSWSAGRRHARARSPRQAARLPAALASSSSPVSTHRTSDDVAMLPRFGGKDVAPVLKLQTLAVLLGTEGGSRTHKPVRTADFESAAFAIPPLRLDSRARSLADLLPAMQYRSAHVRFLLGGRPNGPEPNASCMLYRSRFQVPRSP
jgi:hypothetical protein